MSEEEKCREAFEREFSSYDLTRNERGNYTPGLQQRWTGFRAAWNLRQQVPDGYVLVERGAFALALNALRRDGELRPVRAEIAEALANAVAPKPEDVK